MKRTRVCICVIVLMWVFGLTSVGECRLYDSSAGFEQLVDRQARIEMMKDNGDLSEMAEICEEILRSEDELPEVKQLASFTLGCLLMPSKGGRQLLPANIQDATRAIDMFENVVNTGPGKTVAENDILFARIQIANGLMLNSQVDVANEALANLSEEKDAPAWFWAQWFKVKEGILKENGIEGVDAARYFMKFAEEMESEKRKDISAASLAHAGRIASILGETAILEESVNKLRASTPSYPTLKGLEDVLVQQKRFAMKREAHTSRIDDASTQESQLIGNKSSACGCGSAKKTTAKTSTSSGCGGCGSATPKTEEQKQSSSGCGGCGSAAPKDTTPKKPAGGCGGCGSSTTKPAPTKASSLGCGGCGSTKTME